LAIESYLEKLQIKYNSILQQLNSSIKVNSDLLNELEEQKLINDQLYQEMAGNTLENTK
jgi:hypothetical protein